MFEKALSEVEGDAAKVLREIEAGIWPLSQEQRGILGTFIAVQYVRGPDRRRSMEYLAAQMTRLEVQLTARDNVKQWVQRRYGVEVDDEAEVIWQQATQPGGPPITVGPIAHIEQIIDSAFPLVPFIVGRPWTLARFSRRSLRTCDLPVALVPGEGHEPWRGVGFATARLITYPLTRKLGLIMGDAMPWAEANIPVEQLYAGVGDTAEPGTTSKAKLINHCTVGSSSEYVYQHPDDESVLPSPLPDPRPNNLSLLGYDNDGAPNSSHS